MGKSLDYIKDRVLNQKNTNLEISFDEAFEVSPTRFLKFDKNRRFFIQHKNKDDNSTLNIEILYDPNANFEYFTTVSSVHDGTLMFVIDNVDQCLNKILTLQTYNKNIGFPKNPFDCDFQYTIGDIVVVNEYDEKFSSNQKPWLQERTTVMIPIIYKYKRHTIRQENISQ